MIGDNGLHSAVFGSGLPSFIMNEVGGNFRWGSKSWSGFSPPEIYREVVPDSAVQPRVVVLAFLPKYFWHAYDRDGKTINEEANKYKPNHCHRWLAAPPKLMRQLVRSPLPSALLKSLKSRPKIQPPWITTKP